MILRSMLIPLISLFTFALAAKTDPRVWLVQPQSRLLEHDPTAQRLAETKCPTMKKDTDPKSTLPSGGVVDIIWYNPSNLNGPTKFELLSGEEILAKLEPLDDGGASIDKNRSTKAIRLPDFECKSCVLKLTQFTDNTDTEVVSCADIQLLQLANSNSTAVIKESRVDCTSDKDCNKNGECLKGLCYCPTGKFGPKCDHDSQLTLSKDYTPIELNDAANGNSLQWRYDAKSEQLEFAFEMPADSWVALGLRNKEANSKCSSMLISKDSNTLDELNGENSLTPGLNIRKIVGNYLSTTTPSESLECGANEEFSDCPEFSRECESSCEWTMFPESVPSCPKSCGVPRCVCKPGFVRQANDKNECRPFEYCMALQASSQQCAKNQTYTKCGVACEPSCETMYNTEPCTATCDTSACSCDNNYVRHNGTCIFWGDCPNLEKRVLEDDENESKEQTLVPIAPNNRGGNWTPKPNVEEHKCPTNETWNKCGRVCETDCHKIFDREECFECGKPGCACQQGFARLDGKCIYWNDCNSTSSKSTNKPSTTKKPATFTTIKTSTTQKTSTTILASKSAEMPPSDPEMLCFGEFVHPPRCEGSECLYKLSWAYVPEDDNVEFSLETRMNATGWTGVGFSKTGSMTDADFIIITSDGKSLNIKDMHADSYNSPKVDKVENVQASNSIGSHVDGVLKATFLRKRNTGDHVDDAIFGDKDSECFNFLFPIEGGELTKDGAIAPHLITPMVSSSKICIRACAGQMSDSSEPKINIPTYTCQNEFHYPSNCSDENCDYRARWAYDSVDKSVMFEVSARGIGRWTAIGFSRDGMENSDIILGWVHNGKPYVLDRFAYSRQLPVADPSDKQDIYAIGGSVKDDIQTITFKRKLVTNDTKTDLQLDKCYYFLFPIGGGRILTRTTQDFENPKTPIGYHDLKSPERSVVPVCICDENNKPVGEIPSKRHRRQIDPFDERISPGVLSHLLPAVKKTPGGVNSQSDAFACSDVSVIELSKKRNVRVVDGFALTTESLQPDEAFGGMQSLPSASVILDKNGDKATVILRKKVKTDDIADFNFDNEMGSLVFASGPVGTNVEDAHFVKSVALNLLDPKVPVLSTKQSETVSTTPQQEETTIATTSVSTPQFETTTIEQTTQTPLIADLETETSTQTTEVPTTESVQWIEEGDANCAGSFYYPFDCKAEKCKYVAKWALDEEKSNIRIRLESQLSTNHYTAFGFSKDGSMAGTDAIIVSVLSDSSVTISDQFSPSYGRPTIDASQDLKQLNTAYIDGRVVSTMVRALSTNDNEDADLLSDCHYLIFVPSGGELEDRNNAIHKHTETPLTSKTRFCPSKCQAESSTPLPETSKVTKKSDKKIVGHIPPLGPSHYNRVFDTVLRLMDRKWEIFLEDIESPYAKAFTSDIISNIKPLVKKKWKSFKNMTVTNYAYSTTESIGVTEISHGIAPSVLALVQFTFDEKDSPNADELKDYLKEITSQTLTAPTLIVDPNAVQVQANDKDDKVEEKWGPLRDVANWAVIVIASLILFALIAICLCYGFCRGRRKTHKFQPEHLSFGQPPHSSYHHYSTSYPNMSTMTYEASKADSKGTGSTDTQIQNSSGNGASMSRRESNQVKTPRGIGETTYQEWYSKVASKETPTHHQESMYQTPPTRMLTNAPHGAYVTYPNDPSGYYTLNGDNRVPPPYYRHY